MTMEYTIILVSEKSGKHYSFKMRLFVLIILILLFIAMTAATYITTSRYLSLYQKNSALKTALKKTEQSIRNLEAEKKEALLYGKWADRIIYRRTHNGEKQYSDDTQQQLTPAPAADNESGQDNNVLGIDSIKITRINLEKDFDYSFRLVNTGSKNIKKSGFLFIIASNSSTRPIHATSTPETALSDGRPIEYKKGFPYSIRFLKNISGRIHQPDIGEKYDLFTVLAYSDDGDILMEKSYHIDTLLNSNPYE